MAAVIYLYSANGQLNYGLSSETSFSIVYMTSTNEKKVPSY